MDRPMILVFNNALVPLGVIADYVSLQFERAWNSVGSFTITINVNSPNAYLLKEDNIIYISTRRCGLIQGVKINKGISDTITVTGIELKDIINFRITEPPGGQATDYYTAKKTEFIAKSMISYNIGSTASANRKSTIVAVAGDNGYGTAMDFSTRYKNLQDEVYVLLQLDNLGFVCDVNVSTQIATFDVFEGIDRTAGQSVNNRVIFSLDMGTLLSLDYQKDLAGYRNYAYVGGQGVGAARTITIAGDTTLIDLTRREIFVDARDVETTSELSIRGDQKLSECAKILGIDVDINNNGAYKYMIDFDVGDYVTVMDRNSAISETAQITAATETYSGQSVPSIAVTLGYNPTDIAQKLKVKFSETNASITV